MKVAMVGPFPQEPQRINGGVAGASAYLAEQLSSHPDVDLTLLVPQAARPARERWGGLTIERLAKTGPCKALPGTLYDLAAGRRQVHEALERLAPDIVHFQGTTFLAAGCPLKHVLTIHGIAEKDAAWSGKPLKRAVLQVTEDYGRRLVPHVILISDATREVLPARPGLRTWRIDNPIADAFFDAPRRPAPGRVLSCSRITPLKDTLGLVRALGGLDVELRLAGGGEAGYVERCRAEAGPRAAFLGRLTVREVVAELSTAACFVLASRQENAPLSIAEAMAAGVPVVATRVGSVPEMVEDGATGFVVEPGEPEELAQAVRRVVSEPGLAQAMSRRAREVARRRYRASEVARRTLEVYREILRQ